MNTKLWRKTLIALIAIEILLASCSTPSTPSQAENQTFEPAETNSEKSSFPTTSPTLETLLTNTDIPIPVTDTPVVVTNTPLPPTDTPLPVTDIPIQGTLIPEARATFTEEPSATLTAPPATTLDNSALLDSLQNQLVFALGGGGGPPPGWACSQALQTYTGPFPAIFLGERSPIIERMGSLCLVGQDLKSGLKVTISGIDGTTFGNAGFEIGEIRGLYGVQENPNANVNLVQTNPVMRVWGGELSRPTGSPVIIQLNIWLPPDVNGDTWQVDAQCADWQLNGQVKVTWPEDRPALFLPYPNYDPFVPPDFELMYKLPEGYSDLTNMKPGQSLNINGMNLPPDKDLPLALFQRRINPDYSVVHQLVSANIITTGSKGDFQYRLSIEDWMPPGLYHLSVITDLTSNSPKAGPYIGLYADTCPGAPDSGLLKGDTIEINPEPAEPREIHDKPGINGRAVSEFMPGETAKILRNFHCANQTVWWNVRTSNGVVGWIAEGQGDEKYIVPTE